MARTPIERQVSARIPVISRVFPGLTDKRLGRLSHNQWVSVRDACDDWLRGGTDG